MIMEFFWYFTDVFQYLIGSVIAFIILGYVYVTWEFDYWKKQGVPGETPRLFVGTFQPPWKKSIQDQSIDAMKKHGLVYGGFIGHKPVLYVADPDLVKQVLVKDFPVFNHRRMIGNMEKDKLMGNMLSTMKGEKWKMVRNTLTPTYTSGKLKQMVVLIEECIQHLVESLKMKADNGEPIEFTKKFPLLTLDVIASCAFGMKINCIDNPESEFIVNAQKAFRGTSKFTYFIIILPFLLKLIPKSVIPNTFNYFTAIANQTIDIRLKNKDFTRKDFLQIMLEAEVPPEENQSNTSKKTLTREIITAQTVLFILAGHETTANTINFMVYEIAMNQEIQEKLIKEVDDVMTHTPGNLTYENVASMQYLEMVTSETLRKYPPVESLDRICTDDGYKLDNIILKKGIPVLIPVYAIHHNPKFYPNPDIFDPERFTPENKSLRNPFTYLPFGAGPRNCIAMRFALMEVKLVVAYMLHNYRFQTCPETEYPIKFGKGVGLLHPESIKLVLQKRS